MAKAKVELSFTTNLGNSYEFIKSIVSFEEVYDQDDTESRLAKFHELQKECELRLTDSILASVTRANKIKNKLRVLEE